MDLLVLPSPLLPSATYVGLAEALTRRGVASAVAAATPVSTPLRIIENWSQQVTPGTVLLAHSNAGLMAPTLRVGVGGDPLIVFMDAALPPAVGDTALAPPRMRDQLTSLVDEESGLLPPWTRWWSRDEMLRVIPPGEWSSIDSHCPSVPLSYFDERVRPPAHWVRGRNAYLAFGNTYADEVEFATRHGWPTRRLAGGHMEFLWRVEVVADKVVELLEAEHATGVARRG